MLAIASQSSGAGTAAAILNIWFVCWAIRHRGELDYDLDPTARAVRWLVVAVCFGLVLRLPQLLNPPSLRVCVGIVGIAFLVWPNLAYHTTRFLRLIKLLRTPSSSEPSHGM
jgi:hypothetical protein